MRAEFLVCNTNGCQTCSTRKVCYWSRKAIVLNFEGLKIAANKMSNNIQITTDDKTSSVGMTTPTKSVSGIPLSPSHLQLPSPIITRRTRTASTWVILRLAFIYISRHIYLHTTRLLLIKFSWHWPLEVMKQKVGRAFFPVRLCLLSVLFFRTHCWLVDAILHSKQADNVEKQ